MNVCRPTGRTVLQGEVHLRAGLASKTTSAPAGDVVSRNLASAGVGVGCVAGARGCVVSACTGFDSAGVSFSGSFAGSFLSSVSSTGGGGGAGFSTAAAAGVSALVDGGWGKAAPCLDPPYFRSEEHTSELQSRFG